MSVEKKSTCYLFLDIDGVLIGDRFASPLKEETEQKACELFGPKEKYSRLERKRAGSHFFSPEALKNLYVLIGRIEELMRLRIVLSSEWRRDVTLDQLVKLVFNQTEFSHLLIDKTAEDDQLRCKQIKDWLESGADRNVFVILDDEHEDLGVFFPKQFVKVNPLELLTAEKVEEAFAKVVAQIQNERVTV